MNLVTLLAIGSGGFIGAVSRAYLNGYISHKFPTLVAHGLPIGTLGVNLLGSFFMGLLFAYFLNDTHLPNNIKSFLSTGILGALTTYSTFAIESFLLLHNAHYALAATNMSLNLVGTIVMAGLGFYIVTFLTK